MYWQTGFRARQRDRKLLRIMKSHGISHLKPSYYGNYYYTHAFPKGPILHRAVGKVLLLSMVTYLGLQIAWTKLDMEERNKDIEDQVKQLEYTLRSTVEEQRRLKEAELHLSNNGTTETIKEKKSGWFWK